MNAPRRSAVLRRYSDFSDVPFGAGGVAHSTYFYNRAYNGVVFVLFNGAVPPEADARDEYFQRWTWAGDFGAPVFIVSDRQVGTATGLRLGWYVGRPDGPTFTEMLSEVMARVDALYPGSIKIAVGSSGGGFAALMGVLAGPLHMAIVFNPQTAILDYYPQHVDKFLAFYGRDRDTLTADDMDRLSVRGRVAGIAAPKTVHYFQNVADTFHHDNHMKPFMSETTKLPPEQGALFAYHLYNAPEVGHSPPSRNVMPAIIRNVVSSSSLFPRNA